ncbi:MAG: pirin family protein [Lysobacterales bacterium]
MIKTYAFSQLGHANHGWLDARHHFSFANYYNPDRMGFGALRVINDDIIKAGAGFDTHPHKDMEIITYVRKGAITHRDSRGNQGRTEAGDVQVMSAGTGIFHSEFNLESEDTNLYQIWIEPNETGVQPRWDARKFPTEETKGGLTLLVSGDGRAPLQIHQDATLHAGPVIAGSVLRHAIKHQAYLLVSKGAITLDGHFLTKGDGAEIRNVDSINLTAETDAEVLVIDVPERARH